jgi:hypothetical protein
METMETTESKQTLFITMNDDNDIFFILQDDQQLFNLDEVEGKNLDKELLLRSKDRLIYRIDYEQAKTYCDDKSYQLASFKYVYENKILSQNLFNRIILEIAKGL